MVVCLHVFVWGGAEKFSADHKTLPKTNLMFSLLVRFWEVGQAENFLAPFHTCVRSIIYLTHARIQTYIPAGARERLKCNMSYFSMWNACFNCKSYQFCWRVLWKRKLTKFIGIWMLLFFSLIHVSSPSRSLFFALLLLYSTTDKNSILILVKWYRYV